MTEKQATRHLLSSRRRGATNERREFYVPPFEESWEKLVHRGGNRATTNSVAASVRATTCNLVHRVSKILV